MQFNQFFNPAHADSLFLTVNLAFNPFFVSPVSSNPVFSDLVHFFGTDLNFDWSFWSVNSRVNRLVTVGFRRSNIIFETPWHWTPQFMNITNHSVNIARGFHDTTNGNQIIDLVKSFLFITHFAINRINVFWTTVNVSVKPLFFSVIFNFLDDFINQSFTFTTFFIHHVRNLVELNFIEVTE